MYWKEQNASLRFIVFFSLYLVSYKLSIDRPNMVSYKRLLMNMKILLSFEICVSKMLTFNPQSLIGISYLHPNSLYIIAIHWWIKCLEFKTKKRISINTLSFVLLIFLSRFLKYSTFFEWGTCRCNINHTATYVTVPLPL